MQEINKVVVSEEYIRSLPGFEVDHSYSESKLKQYDDDKIAKIYNLTSTAQAKAGYNIIEIERYKMGYHDRRKYSTLARMRAIEKAGFVLNDIIPEDMKPIVTMPLDFLYLSEKSFPIAFTMQYIEAITLLEYLQTSELPEKKDIIKKVSEILKRLHSLEIFFFDLNLNNILVKNDNPIFCDVLSGRIEKTLIPNYNECSNFISLYGKTNLARFFPKSFQLCKNREITTLLIESFIEMYNISLPDISLEKWQRFLDVIGLNKEAREVLGLIKSNLSLIKDLPYPHEFLDEFPSSEEFAYEYLGEFQQQKTL